MPAPINERPEIIIHSKSKEQMLALRKAIGEKFTRVWLMVHCDNSRKQYCIEVATVWGNRLPKHQEEEISKFAKGWMKEASKS